MSTIRARADTTPGIGSTLARGLVELRRPGESGLPGPTLWRLGQLVLTAVIVTTNLIGACAVLGIANFVWWPR